MSSYDPYQGAKTQEEREAIYQNLLVQYEEATQDYNRKKTVYSDLIPGWKYQRDNQIDLDQRIHKALLTVASGSFGVSFAFISQIVKLEHAFNIWLLITSWALFAFTIILEIMELKIGSIIQDYLLNTIEKNIERGYEGKPYKEPNKKTVSLPGKIMGWVSFISFTTGVICLIFFVLINI